MTTTTPDTLAWDDDRRARLALSHLTEPGPIAVLACLTAHGASEALDRVRSGALDADVDYRARLRTLDVERSIHNLEVAGVRYLVPDDPEWPSGVEDLTSPPIGLFVRGPLNLAEATERAVGVVGARAASTYGVHVATELGAALADRGATVVSGAAFGIDAAAHRGALSADGPTIAVLACGLDRPYPPAHTNLIERIGEVGLVVSEIPLGGAPFRSRFLARNRLIATLGLGIVVVEAGHRSGSLNTAKWAREAIRHVGAVPGPVTAMSSAGCHKLIRDTGATLVTDAAEVLDLMGRIGLDLLPAQPAEAAPDHDLEPRQRVLWSAVPVRTSATVDELAVRCGENSRAVRAMLGRLELLGLVVPDGDGWRKPRKQPVAEPRRTTQAQGT